MTALEHLLSLLGNQREVCQRLLELVREERSCLLNSRLDCLEAIVEEQSALLAKQGAGSTLISRDLERLADELCIEGRISLARLIEHLPASPAEQARAYYRDLTTLADDIQREGRVNWHLAQQALSYVDFTLRMVGRAKAGPQPYAVSASQDRTAVRLLMDNCA